ncbi:MAG: VWA domain-containing protein [Saprospiraceae bacterium]
MFKFEENNYLILLVLLPVFYILYLNYKKSSMETWKKLGVYSTLKNFILVPNDKLNFKFLLFCFILLFSILGLVNPQFGKKTEKIKSQNIDVFIALDVSQSMLCTDIKPDRLSRAQIWIKQFLDRFRSERIGFISFAGSAYLHSPLTTDMPTIQLMTSMAGPKNIGTQGTAIAEAIELAMKSFGEKEGFHKVILLLSDGEDHEGAAIESAKKAAQKGITVFTVPVGTEQGGPIPNPIAENYRVDEEGKLIITKPNRKLLAEIAETGQGEILDMQNGELIFEALKKRFSMLARKDVTYQSFSSYQSYFQYFLLIAFGLLIFESFLTRKKNEI